MNNVMIRTNDKSELEERAIRYSQECLESLLTSRIEVILQKISRNPEYIELTSQHETRENEVDKILEKLTREEMLFVRRHYENQTTIENYELKETYKQGIRDGIRFLLGLEIFNIREI